MGILPRCLPPSAQQPCSVVRRIRRMLDTGGPRGVAFAGRSWEILKADTEAHCWMGSSPLTIREQIVHLSGRTVACPAGEGGRRVTCQVSTVVTGRSERRRRTEDGVVLQSVIF